MPLKDRKKATEYARAWRLRNPGKTQKYNHSYWIKWKYGVTREWYDATLKKQNGLCALCGKRKAKPVDHDHQTNKVRGILCVSCNTGLKWYEEKEWWKRAEDYLKRPTGDEAASKPRRGKRPKPAAAE